VTSYIWNSGSFYSLL